jgi:iron complex transport system substrate-binding protein
VHAFNQRTIAEILDMIRMLGAMVGCPERAERLAQELKGGLTAAASQTGPPRVYFEEWDDPMICGVAWVSELIYAAGGEDIFADRARGKSAKERFVTIEEIAAGAPDLIIGSWCGKKFRPERVAARPGLETAPAIQRGALHEIKSSIILQPGPAALTDGLAALRSIIGGAARAASTPAAEKSAPPSR